MNLVDQWLAINAKYFPTEQVQYIRQRLEALPEQQLHCFTQSASKILRWCLSSHFLVVLLESTALFWDKLVLVLVNFWHVVDVVSGQSLTGSLSWMLLANQTLKNYLQLLANEKLFHTLVGLPPAFF